MKDLYISPQQWANENNIDLENKEVKKAIMILWKTLQVEINLYKKEAERWKKSYKRCKEDLSIILSRTKK